MRLGRFIKNNVLFLGRSTFFMLKFKILQELSPNTELLEFYFVGTVQKLSFLITKLIIP